MLQATLDEVYDTLPEDLALDPAAAAVAIVA